MDALQAELDEGKPKDEASQSEALRFSRWLPPEEADNSQQADQFAGTRPA